MNNWQAKLTRTTPLDAALRGQPPQVQRRLTTSFRARFTRGEMCPDCGNEAGIESNGAREYRCPECDHRWGIDDQSERYGY